MQFFRHFRKPYFVIQIILFVTISARAQVRPNYCPPSPEASSLGIYSAIPVNFYSGIPNISVPISEIKIKNLSFPINISYYSGGIRKSEEASSVGLGWSLNAGGVIARTKRHKDDFSANGYYKQHPNPNLPCNDDNDQEPDLFCFNFAGRTGKFIMSTQTGNIPVIKLFVEEQLKISVSATGGWTILDENGTRYEFEKKENSHEVTYNGQTTKIEDYVSSWYLTRIQNIYGEVVNYLYNNNTTKTKKIFSSGFIHYYTSISPGNLFDGTTCIGGVNSFQQAASYLVPGGSVSTTTLTTDVVTFNSIQFSNGSISFVYGIRSDLTMDQPATMYAQKIDQIIIKDAEGFEQRRFYFTYSYFLPQSGSTDEKLQRLKLLSIQERFVDLTKNSFTMDYTSTTLEDKGNSITNGGFMSSPYFTNGLLKKITYPTGGFTEFVYEPHFQYAGVRIKTISQNDGIQNTGIKSYEYIGPKSFVNPSTSFFNYPTSVQVEADNCGSGIPVIFGSVSYANTYYSDQNIMGETSSDYIVGYDQVVENDGSAGENGKTVYTFYNDDAVINTPNTSSLAAFASVPSVVPNRNGIVKMQEEYVYKNSAYTLVRNQTTDIEQAPLTSLTVARYNGYNCNSTYALKNDWIKTTNTALLEYDLNGLNPKVVSQTFYYNYANDLRPSKIEFIDSKGNIVSNSFKYPQQKSVEVGGVYTTMTNKNYINPVIEEWQMINGNPMSKRIDNYKDWFSNGSVVALETQQFQKGNSPFITTFRVASYDQKGNPLELSKENDSKISYQWGYNGTLAVAEATNAPGNEIFFESFEEPGTWNALSAYDFDKPFSGSYSARIDKPTAGEYVAHSNKWLNISLATPKKFRYSGWVYSNGPSVEMFLFMKRTGETGYYSYIDIVSTTVTGKWVFLEKEFTVPADVTQLNIRIDNNGGGTVWYDDIRLYPAAASLITYTYKPLVGITSETDANNRVIYYEYDGLGRLILVKDQDKNILKQVCYNYAGQPENCGLFYNASLNTTFYSTTCGTYFTGAPYTYNVPARKYVASSQPSADQMAWNDASGNGQAKADMYGTCVPTYVYAACCGWNCPFKTFALTGTGSVNFTVVVYKTTTGPAWTSSNQIGNLSGPAFVPSALRNFNVFENGRTWTITLLSTGQFYIQLTGGVEPGPMSTISLSGTYNL